MLMLEAKKSCQYTAEGTTNALKVSGVDYIQCIQEAKVPFHSTGSLSSHKALFF